MIRNTVCLPGFMLGPDLFTDLEHSLAGRLDLQHGDVYSDTSIAGMAERVLSAAPKRFNLLGFSMGGFVAREIALAAPERVEALILVGTSARATSEAEHARKEAILSQLAETGFKGMSRKALSRGVHPDHPNRDGLIVRLRAMGAELGGAVMARQLQATRVDGYGALPRVAAPTLVVAAREDLLRPLAELKALAAGIPNARLEIFERCGHMIPMEKPDQLAESIMAFLNEL